MTLPEALDLLRTRKTQYPNGFGPGATDEDIREANARLFLSLPGAWQQVLRISNGFNFFNGSYDCYFSSSKHIATSDRGHSYFHHRLSPPHLIIGDEDSGGSFALDVSRQTPEGDCPVVWVGRDDDGEEKEEWDGISQCLGWVLQETNDLVRAREAEAVRLHQIRERNEACRRLAQRELRCPHCGSSGNARFFDKGPDQRAYFICSACGRSFGPAEAPGDRGPWSEP